MKHMLLAAVVLALAVPAMASAETKEKPVNDPPGPLPESNCQPGSEWKPLILELPTPVPIPDDDNTGVTFVIDARDEHGSILDMIVCLDIRHTWVGDLTVYLTNDPECDGVDADDPTVALLCRPNLAGCPGNDSCCGCSGNLIGTYCFSDKAAQALGEPNCPTDLPPGCYLPAPESAPLSIFTHKNGCWWLNVRDGAGADLGTVNGLTIWLLNGGPSGVEASSWGSVRAEYQN